MRVFGFLCLFTLLSAAEPALGSLPSATDAGLDERNDTCARLAVSAQDHTPISADDPALDRCAQGSRTVCERTKALLDASPDNQGLLKQCAGPQEVAVNYEKVIAACKLAMFALGCYTNGLPATGTLEDVNSSANPAIIRPSPMRQGIITQ